MVKPRVSRLGPHWGAEAPLLHRISYGVLTRSRAGQGRTVRRGQNDRRSKRVLPSCLRRTFRHSMRVKTGVEVRLQSFEPLDPVRPEPSGA